jgi:cellulose synthase/poly-beta-1,6-N-acetylglucosamine synthase-like glycosyltransferase
MPVSIALVAVQAAAAAHVTASWFFAARRGTRASSRPAVDRPRNGAWPSVSVIVPAWLERSTIAPCLEALAAVDYPNSEVLVVAGGNDGTYAAAVDACSRVPRCRVLEQAPRGKPAALNAGVNEARGEVVVFLDADSRVQPGWLRALVAPIDGRCRASTGRALAERDTPISRGEQMERIDAYEVRGRSTLQGSSSIAIERSLVEELGGFPIDSYADDWELDARLASRGIHRAYCRDAVLWSERPATLSEYWRNELRWRRAHLASLGHLRAYFFRDPASALGSIYPYAVAWMLAVGTAIALIVVVAGTPEQRPVAATLWATAVAWLLLRPVGLALEVAAFAHDRKWLRDVWVPPTVLPVTLLAAAVASLSVRKATLQFKGPRPAGSTDARSSRRDTRS